MTIEIMEVETFNQGPQIKVIGVGGGGSNAVMHMIGCKVNGAEFICANTDAQALARCGAHKSVQLGFTGLGAGSKPEKGREAAETAEEEIREAIEGANMLFIAAGMGGGTGTGAAPVIARIAREMGILTVGVVTKPFEFEAAKRMANAEAGLTELEANVDSLIVVLNDKLLEVLGEDVTQEEAFAYANDVLRNAVGGITEVINGYSYINVDFEDVRTVMGEPGKALMGTATAHGPDRARIAAEQAIACPLLDGVDLSGARGVLVLITASKTTLKLNESRLAMQTIRAYAAEDAHVIYGASYDEALGDELRVTVIATGLASPRRSGSQKPELTVLRTGTDNAPFMASALSPGMAAILGGQSAADAARMTTPASAHGAPLQPQAAGLPSDTNVPSVWRSGRTHAAARVDALSLSGMDEMEIPAFLRKQAD